MEKTKVKKLVTSAITLSMAFSTLAPSMVFATDDVKPRDIVTKVNHALNGTATANNSETSYWGPDKAIDGIVNRDAAKPDQSRWSTNMGTTPDDPINPVTPEVLRTTYHASSVMIISTNT